jgi:hypothetical protein
MTPHGPDTATFEAAIAPEAEAPSHLGRDTLAFMFETHATPRVTPAALSSPAIDRDYYRWAGGLAWGRRRGGVGRAAQAAAGRLRRCQAGASCTCCRAGCLRPASLDGDCEPGG